MNAPTNFISWSKYNQDYERILWLDLKNYDIFDEVPWLKDAADNGLIVKDYVSYLSPSQKKVMDSFQDVLPKVDYLRLILLKQVGGFYIDCDVQCLSGIPDWLRLENSVSFWENEFNRPGLMANTVLASVPNSDFIKKCVLVIEEMVRKNKSKISKDKSLIGRAWEYTGPMLLTYIYQKYKISTHTVYPSKMVYPVYPNVPSGRINELTFGDHRWDYGSSEGNEERKNRSILFNFTAEVYYSKPNLIDDLLK